MGKLLVLLGVYLSTTAAIAGPGLEVSLPSYVKQSAIANQDLKRGGFGVKITGVSQWVNLHQATLKDETVSVEHLSGYVHARRAEVYQTGKRLRLKAPRRWWLPLPRFDWTPFRRVWVSARNIGVHIRMKHPFRATLPRPVQLKFVQVGTEWKPVLKNPEEFSTLLGEELDKLLDPETFQRAFHVEIYGFGYPVDPLLNRGWKMAKSPLLSLIRAEVHKKWIPQVVEQLREGATPSPKR